MAWTYRQHSGELLHNGKRLAVGYSGHGRSRKEGRNNHNLEWKANAGPIPTGTWHIGRMVHRHKHLTDALPLTPANGNVAYYRDHFLIHGDSADPKKSGNVSEGCIILKSTVRHMINKSPDKVLIVEP